MGRWKLSCRRNRSIAPATTVVNRVETRRSSRLSAMQLVGAAYNWSLCLLLIFLLLCQFLIIVLSSSQTRKHSLYGRNPLFGNYAISGFNDEPYSDRVIVCRRRGRRFDVISVNEALSDSSTVLEDRNGANVNGYRVVNRTGLTINDATKQSYINTCSRLNTTIEQIFSVCTGLGYSNVTRDTLRVVDDIDSSKLYRIPNALPVLIMPFWDNAVTARYAIPGWDGSACMFRLGGNYEVADSPNAFLTAVNRTVRESKTVEWLGRPDGVWKNGWYEDPEGMKWYSDVTSSNPLNPEWLPPRRFDMIGMRELNCIHPQIDCDPPLVVNTWGNLLQTSKTDWATSITISNGNRYGIFLFESYGSNIITCEYDFASFTSDLSLAWLLVQWLLSMIAVQRGFFKGVSSWHYIDIGCLANSYSFGVMMITALPRTKMIIAAFCAVGCEFEGSQRALSDAWFVIYPSIVKMVLLHSSFLNILSRIFRRRMISWHIPVTIVLLSVMHWLREQIGASNRFGYDGRVATLVSAQEFEAMTFLEVLKPSTNLLLNGNIKPLLLIKIIALLLNSLPIVFSENMSLNTKRSQNHVSCASEASLSIRACNAGGIGRSELYEWGSCSTGPRRMLNSYELVRLGYVVVGNTYLMTWESWIRLAFKKVLRRMIRAENHRVIVIEIINRDGQEFSISNRPQMMNLNDPKLVCIRMWDIDSRRLC